MAWEQGLSQDEMKKMAENKYGNGSDGKRSVRPYLKGGLMKFYIPRDGDNLIRIVPPIEIRKLSSWYFDVPVHFSVGVQDALDGTPEKELFGNYICNAGIANLLAYVYGADVVSETKCYRCQERIRLWHQDNETAKKYFAKTRKLVLVNDLLSEDPEEVLLWSGPQSFVTDIFLKSSNKETGTYQDISHPVDGVPVSFEKRGTGILTKYSNLQLFSNPRPLSDSVDSQRIRFIDFLIFSTYDDIKLAHISEVQGNLDGVDTSSMSAPRERTTPAPSTQESAEEDDIPFQGNPECFGKEYGAYDKCDDSCSLSSECKIERRSSKAVAEEKATPKNENGDKTTAIKDRISAAIKRNGK